MTEMHTKPVRDISRGRDRVGGGYTYIEILTVISTLGVLVALLLPAVQAAREAARRCNCARHLEQISIAVQQYESAFQVYPAGTVNPAGPIRNTPAGYHHNWIAQILPYLEARNAYDAIDRSASVYAAVHVPVRRLEFSFLRCPSSGASGKGYSDYAGVHNDSESPIDIDNNGVFFLNSGIRYEDIPDGVSNTYFIGEKMTFAGDLGWLSGTRATLRNLGVPPSGMPGARVWAREPPPDLIEGEPVQQPLQGDQLLDALFGAYLGQSRPMSGTPDEQPPPFRRPTDAGLAVGGFGSMHPGGCQFARGDGSVTFVTQTMDLRLYMNMGHRADLQMVEMEY